MGKRLKKLLPDIKQLFNNEPEQLEKDNRDFELGIIVNLRFIQNNSYIILSSLILQSAYFYCFFSKIHSRNHGKYVFIFMIFKTN